MIYQQIQEARYNDRRLLAVLIDPDKAGERHLDKICANSNEAKVDFFFVGGSLITSGDLERTIAGIKRRSDIPVVIFPGNHQQIDEHADAILLLSLISGRNPDLLIGQHVMAAQRLKASELEIIPTGYLLIDGGNMTTVQYVSGTAPIPVDKPEIAAYTALAGEQLGLKLIFTEAGSGANHPVPTEVIRAIKREINIPLIVGGGVRTKEAALQVYEAGADVVVVGNHFEKNPDLIREIAEARNKVTGA
ncbi:MAG TPA: geranylgeranylglyceryl/heptaprenylglyceryl phosphate synthase [Bacteroidia bacterium]|jgi:putative glycerol-1-phosphate prenyltransferase|nr:geranylgeranylglyceryl/heptaprenylglyceryl phosphate synthase [Bacteroidia bacterium]HQF28182.1 geranylgeranylglyceryl/heptaprenylglyceryl phosphate synthase [Bacteroidia bacterium]HQK98184.1 geranylgeranylglyceryl/heptaprenylglyceryl phosphate synthase [Bacteroidia bacterium]